MSSAIGVVMADKTGLTEIYDYSFLWTAGGRTDHQGQTRPPTPEERAAEVSALLEESLGLRLEPQKAIPVEMIVVDQVEKPTEN
jgi:uncharacterized protein (TIGR03435 family)